MEEFSPALAALEGGHVGPVADERPVGSEVARRWAVSIGLRPGNCTPRGLKNIRHLLPLVDVWAAGYGWSGPDHVSLGVGLALAGVYGGRRRDGLRRLLLHRDDSVLLQRMAREAGTLPPPKPRKPLPRLKRVKPKQAEQPLFHEELRRLGRRAVPLCDSIGRVWPSAAHAAAALEGESPRTVSNRASLLRMELARQAQVLSKRVAHASMWRGVWWRRLTPAEVLEVPQCARSGDAVPGYWWGLVCTACGERAYAADYAEGAGI